MNDEEWIITVCLRRIFQSIREADSSTIHYSLFIIHDSLPSHWDGYKKSPHPNESGVGYKMHSTVPPWLRHRPPLIDAVTGAPDRPFPTGSSEVVGRGAGVQSHFSGGGSSLGIFPGVRSSSKLVLSNYITEVAVCQSFSFPPEKVTFRLWISLP